MTNRIEEETKEVDSSAGTTIEKVHQISDSPVDIKLLKTKKKKKKILGSTKKKVKKLEEGNENIINEDGVEDSTKVPKKVIVKKKLMKKLFKTDPFASSTFNESTTPEQMAKPPGTNIKKEETKKTNNTNDIESSFNELNI